MTDLQVSESFAAGILLFARRCDAHANALTLIFAPSVTNVFRSGAGDGLKVAPLLVREYFSASLYDEKFRFRLSYDPNSV